MLRISTFQRAGMAALVGGIVVAAPSPAIVPPASAEIQLAGLEDGEASFVVSDIGWALGPDANVGGGCPAGFAKTALEVFQATPEGRRLAGESDEDYSRRLRPLMAAATSGAANQPNACAFPNERGPDPHYRTLVGSNMAVDGIDLDGKVSRAGAKPAAGTCAHEDFRGVNGERGVDNQFFRAVGCTTGFQSSGGKRGFGTEMLTGAWGIVIKLRGVDSLVNDPDVEVGIHANADPIQLSPARTALHFATYAVDADPRFQARTRGRIVNGVLTTDPVNVRFRSSTNSMRLERPIDDAQLRMTFNKDGSIEGIMGGYTKVDELYDFVVGYRNGKTGDGKLAPERLRFNSAAGSSDSAGFTCNGIYHAMKKLADGQRDPKTGQCGAISNQYKIKAVPAFVIDGSTGTNLASSAQK